MVPFLGRFQPRNPFLAFAYWIIVMVAAVAVLFAVFFFLDNFLPGQGMF